MNASRLMQLVQKAGYSGIIVRTSVGSGVAVSAVSEFKMVTDIHAAANRFGEKGAVDKILRQREYKPEFGENIWLLPI